MFAWRKQLAILTLALAFALTGVVEVFAVAPSNIITYQGRVLSANGVPVSDASLSMKFFLYTASSGGTCAWSNSSATCDSNTPGSTTARTVTLTSGLFTQNLGNTSDSFAAIADATFADNASLYLEVIIGTETLSPRRLITAAPYALNSQTLDGLSSADFDLDRVYDNDSGSALAIDGASGLTFTSSVAANFTVNLASTGDFVVQDNGTAAFTVNDSGNTVVAGDLTVSGDDLFMGTNTSGFILVADGTNYNPVAVSGDATLSSAGALAIAANAVALTTDTTGNYVASIADAGNSTVTVVNGSAEGGAVTLNVIDVNCTDCLGATEISDIYLLNSGDTITSDLTFSNGTTDSPNATFSPATGTSWLLYVEDAGDDFQILTNTASTETLDILNGGAGVINVTIDGGATLGGDLTISGDDLFMGTNTSGFFLVADGTNYNPVALSGDATLASTGALTIAANAIALSTDTTGNYVATIADSGNSTITVVNGTAEGGAATLNVVDVNCTDCLTATEITDIYLLNSGDITSGDIEYKDGVGDSPKAIFTPATGTNWSVFAEDTADDFQIETDTASVETMGIVNIGAGTNNLLIDGDLTIEGDDLKMTTNTSGAVLVGDGSNFNPVVMSGDVTISSAGAVTIAADSVALTTDTTGNYVASTSTSVLTGLTGGSSGSEGAALSLAFDYSQALSGDVGLSANAGVFGISGFAFEGSTADTIETYISVTDPTATDKTITVPNLTGTVILSGHTFTGDVTATLGASNTTALTIAADAWDFVDFEDTLDLDAATDINLGANLFSIDLDSTGDFAIRDGTTNVVLFQDDSTVDITFPTAAFLTIDAATTANTNTTGVIDLNVSAGDAAVDALNIALTQNNGATGGTQATGLELSLEGNDADGDMFGIRVTSTATTNAAAGTYDALMVLTNNENTAGAVTDAIRITSGAGTVGSITTGLDFDTTDITTDIEFQNGATLANDTDSNLAFVENSLTFNIDFSEVASTIQLETGSDFDIDGSADGEDAIEINASAGGINILASAAADGEDIDIIATGSSVHISSTQAATDAIVLDSSTNASGIILIAGDNEVDGPGVDGNDIALRAEDDVIISPTAGGQVIIDAATDVDSTLSSQGVLQLQVDTSTNANNGFVIDYQSVADAGTDNLFAQSILLAIDNDASATDTVVGLYISSSNLDVSGAGTGIRIEKAETTATGDADMSVGLHLVNIDTDADLGGADQASDISNGIYFESTPGTTGGFVYGLNFDNADITTAEIVFENGDTLANQTDGTFTFARDTNADVTILGADSSGAANLIIDTTGAGAITLGSADVTSITLTTDNGAAGDVGITGGLTVTSGATHNSFTVTSSADTETGAVVTANSLTTGKGVSVTSSSTGFTSGTLLDIDYDASGSLSAKTASFTEITGVRENTATTGTLSDNYDLARLVRSSTQNGAGGAFSSVGSVLYVENAVAATAGTITDTANGIEVVMDADGTGHGMIITMGTVGAPAANGVNNQGLVIDVNETASTDAVFLIRSDADGTADTEFRVDNDGDFQYDGTGSTPASDLAEVYPSAQALAPGDLVALDSTGGLKITKTTTAFQGGLFGAISTKPAIRMGADVIGYDVALVGRIPLKVSGEAGAIAVGDPLTASSTVGHAMKAMRAGMIVGYALESFDGTGTGVIEAFIDVGWFAGNVIGTDGSSMVLTDKVVVAPLGTASAQAPTFGSYGLALRGSAWDGAQAQAVEMMLTNTVTSANEYRLSIRNTAESEVAYITNEGTMKLAGDMVVGGHLYPSDRGVAQTGKYIYYDGSAGAGGDFMRTNAKGWATGSYDFAEMFPSTEALKAGEVVAFALDGERVVRASGLQGEALAGIVSTRPGFLAGENVDGSYPVALAGRVPTRVNLDGGAIKVGDPLTASPTAGIAMKAVDAGQVVGYALEHFDGTQSDDLILAYVNVGYWAGETPAIDNRASEVPASGMTAFGGLNMTGDIFMGTHQMLGVGKLEGAGGLWSLDADGTLKTEGLVKTLITSYQNEKIETVATTSPDALITLSGTSTLVEGRAEVRFEDVDPRFNDVISAIAPIRVLVTPSGPVSIYISQKDQNHFVATRFQGDVDVEFDWMVIGYRKGYEPVVQQKVEEAVEAVEVGEVIEVEEVETAPVEEEPADPVSPDTTPVDQATQGDGGEEAEEPPQVDDHPIDPPEEPLAP